MEDHVDRKTQMAATVLINDGWYWAPADFCKTKYKQRHNIENMFSRLKDWRRVATRYDRRADVFMAAITIAEIGIWWIQ